MLLELNSTCHAHFLLFHLDLLCFIIYITNKKGKHMCTPSMGQYHMYITYHLPTKFPTPVPHQFQLPTSMKYLGCYHLSFPVNIVISYHQLSFPSAVVYFLFLSYHCLILLYFCLLSTPINFGSHLPCVSLLTYLPRPGVS